ncbi:MAG TPA: hypothetical protein VLF91_03695 [Candidatus Saccharimonadales bacterium]|nr:hypothetical protein [Candidatus Saccharimonadales bacterium]
MYFVSSEQAERSEAFDRYVGLTLDALSDDAVQDPSLRAELQAAAEGLYLPNVVHDRVLTPQSIGSVHGRVALLPLTEYEASANCLNLAPIAVNLGPCRPIIDSGYSEVHGRSLDRAEFHALLQPYDRGIALTSDYEVYMTSFSPDIDASTDCAMKIDLRTRQYRIGRQIVQIRSNLLDTQPPRVGATIMAHELVHVVDLNRMGPLYVTASGATATELRAYDIQSQVLGDDYPDSDAAKVVADIARLRSLHCPPDKPYFANDAIVQAMLAARYVEK